MLQVQATPNHPVMTKEGIKNIGSVKEGEQMLYQNKQTGRYEIFTVFDKAEKQVAYKLFITWKQQAEVHI